jgi:molybdate-binding protein
MLDASHSGLLSDRLIIAGSDDALLARVVNNFAHDMGNKALISYSPTSTRLGLELLQAHRLDVCCMHWGPAAESRTRHPALLRHFSQHENWVLIRAFKREHGLMINPQLLENSHDPSTFFDPQYRWVRRQTGSGTLRFLQEMLSQHGKTVDNLNNQVNALSEHEAAAAIVMDLADIAAGVRAIAIEHGLAFIPLGWETFDFALPRSIWFRHLFQNLIKQLKSVETQHAAEQLGGYDFSGVGELVWGAD